MQLARELHMTLAQLLANTTSEELSLWQALFRAENEEREKAARLDALTARAGASLQNVSGKAGRTKVN